MNEDAPLCWTCGHDKNTHLHKQDGKYHFLTCNANHLLGEHQVRCFCRAYAPDALSVYLPPLSEEIPHA